MSTFVLLPGAGGDSWYWHRVAPLLRGRGHDVVAPDLPAEDESAGLDSYVDTVVRAIADRLGVVLVAQSMAALYAPIVCERADVGKLILVAPMIPAAGETGGEWWERSGQVAAQREQDEREGRDPDAPFDPETTFLHDVPPDVLAEALERGGPRQSSRPFADPNPLERWPDVPTRVIAARQDRLFPLPFVRQLAAERLGVEPEVTDTGHLPALSKPDELVRLLLAA